MTGETLDAIGIKEILAMLPHRYPFLLVDRITDIRGDEHGIGIKNVTINEPHFMGHFPEQPGDAGRACARRHGADRRHPRHQVASARPSRSSSTSSPSTRRNSASR